MNDEPRPSVKMSVEEHASIQEVKIEVRTLTDTLGKFIEASDKRFSGIEQRQEKIAESRQLSLQNIAVFVGLALGLAGAVSTLNSMTIKTTIAAEVMPTVALHTTQNTISIADRAALHERQDKQEAAMIAGKEARLTDRENNAVANAVQNERISELYYHDFGHYPRN